MFSSGELKKKALLSLKNNWANPLIISLLFVLITGTIASAVSGIILVFTLIPALILSFFIDEVAVTIITQGIHYILSLAVNLIIIPLSLGYINYFLMFTKSQKPEIQNLFDGYKKSFGNSIIASLLMGIYIFLWSLLLIIPGIIKSFSYAMTFYIIADNPTISATDALKRSEAMMKGHKMDYFVLNLSFIGWIILSLFTCGIGIIFLNPYMETAKAHFYLTLKENFEEENNESIVLEEF